MKTFYSKDDVTNVKSDDRERLHVTAKESVVKVSSDVDAGM